MKSLLGFLLLVGVVLVYWKWLVLAGFVVWVWAMTPVWIFRCQASQRAERERVAAIIARADEQHRWTMAGDPRGTYGDYTPAV